MKKESNIYKNIWFYVFIIGFFLIVYLLIPKAGAGVYDTFATCLTDTGATMYGTDWCPHCKDQKAMFEGSFNKIDYVNCDSNQEACLRAGVEGYPTWVIGSQKVSGTQSLAILASMSSCELIRDEVE